MQLQALTLKIPKEYHSLLKQYAVRHSINMLDKAAELLTDGIKELIENEQNTHNNQS